MQLPCQCSIFIIPSSSASFFATCLSSCLPGNQVCEAGLWSSHQTCDPAHFMKQIFDGVQLGFISSLLKGFMNSDIYIVFI